MNEIILQIRDLTKAYGPVLAVNHLSLEVARGEIFGFLGPNGAGKTTAINMMIGLLAPTAGDVFIDGQSIRDGSARVIQQIGVCTQENILWEKLTCLEQLEFMGANYNIPRRKARQHGSELLEALGLGAKANVLAGQLSGGMKRRLNLALALIHDPQLVFLDEPEAGLDPQSRVLVRDYIHMLARRKTVVLTTHNMDEADRLADRVAIIDHGDLLVVDTPEALKRRLGEGTVLEMEFADPCEQDRFQLDQIPLNRIQQQFPDAVWASGMLSVRGQELAAHLPELLQTLQEVGLKPSNMHMRAITLEDVFLSLTGRGLRE